jgi:NAD(P)-dependent dehydrogenase (short-subunit alcohol dehydrogenase family)
MDGELTPDGASSLSGRRVLVTGSTTGIGFATAEALSAAGCQVIVHGPDSAEADAAADVIRGRVPGAAVDTVFGNLGSQTAVRQLATTIESRYETLDVLVNNAAAVFDGRSTNGDSVELTFAVNYVAVYLLTRLLLPMIERAPHGRVIVVGSEAHRGVTLDLDDLQMFDGYERFEAYGRSKLADLLFTYELSRRTEPEQVAVVALHPGTTKTTLFRPRNPVERVVMPILNIKARSPQQAADTAVWLATSDDARAMHGRYVGDRRVVESSAESRDPEIATRLWNITAEMTGLEP